MQIISDNNNNNNNNKKKAAKLYLTMNDSYL